MNFLLPLLFWLVYFIVWIWLFLLNFLIFKKAFKVEITKEILLDNNKSLSSIIKWQLIWQSIMISSLIYFFWTTLDKIYVNWVFLYNNFLYNIIDLISFWLIWIIMFQLTIFIVWKVISLEKDIMIEQNEAVWIIIEWLLIAMSILLSFSIYSY